MINVKSISFPLGKENPQSGGSEGFCLGWLDYLRSSYSHLQMMYAATSAITERIKVSKLSTKKHLLSTEKGRNPTE